MKKLPIICLVLSLILGGCASVKPDACSPTMDQVDAAILMAGQIATLLPFVPSTVATVLNELLPKLKQVKDGWCISDMDNFLAYAWQQIVGAEKVAKTRGFPGFAPGLDQKPRLLK